MRGHFGSNFSRLVTESPRYDCVLSQRVVLGIPRPTPRLASGNIRWSRTNENRVFLCLWCHPRSLVTEINMAEYGSCCKQREAIAVKSHRNSRESIPWRTSSTVSVFCHIYFCHERTMVTSETSENTIFVRFYFTLCSLMLTQLLGYQPQKLDSMCILRVSADLKSGDPWYKSLSDHQQDLFHCYLVQFLGCVYTANWSASCQLGFLTCWVCLSCLFQSDP